MEIKWIETFIVAAKNENFRKAAEELYLTQPAVTKHIQRLEERLQVDLFIREGKSIRLSAAGHKYLPHAKAMLAEYENGLAAFASWKQGYHQKLTIAAAPQIASSILPSILNDFMNQFPEIEVLINVVNSYEVLNEVQVGNADVGLTRIYSPHMNMECEVVFQEPVVLVAPYQIKEDNESDILLKYRLITHNHPVYWDDLLIDINRHYEVTKTFKVNQIEVTKRFIEQGLGVSYLPHSMVKKELQQQAMKMVTPDKIALPVSQTYLCTKVKTNEVEVFIHFFKKELERFL